MLQYCTAVVGNSGTATYRIAAAVDYEHSFSV